MANNQLTVQQLVASKAAKTESTEKAKVERFMLQLAEKDRENLRTLCEDLGVKQISFASEIFVLALNQAIEAAKAAKSTTK